MCVRLRLLLILTLAPLFGGIRAYPQCEKDAERSHYNLEEVTFEARNAFPAGQLRRLIPISVGGVFSVPKISDGMQAIRKLYDEHGYISFTLVPEAQCDQNRKLIHLKLILDEGEQFRLGKLLVLAPKDAAERLDAAWPMKPGSIYEPALVQRFLTINRALLPNGWNHLAIRLDEKNRTVEVRLNVCPADHFCPQLSREFWPSIN
jgi:outer membrane protein assembly factor BamA